MAANRDHGDFSSQLKGHFGPPECRSQGRGDVAGALRGRSGLTMKDGI
jgi:hypothetical protein